LLDNINYTIIFKKYQLFFEKNCKFYLFHI